MSFPLEDDDSLRCPPLPVLPEMYADLDMQLLTAHNEQQLAAAVVAGTREVLDRLAHIGSPSTLASVGPDAVVRQLRSCVAELLAEGNDDYATWLQSVVDVLEAHLRLQVECAEEILNAGTYADTAQAITESVSSLQAAADAVAAYPFAPYPPRRRADPPDYQLMIRAGTCLAAETHRVPLRTHLDGVGGAAGSPEFNPYVAALLNLELTTHRRLYRLFYELCFHVGFDLNSTSHSLFDSPDMVDTKEL